VATRIDAARRLLSDPQLQIKEIAAEMGFSSEFYFSTYFRRETGMSPSEFRSICRL
jgi:AraC-like DNA-binding protein